ncbi:MAG: hypothetical protein HW387_419 [Parachlamydiales bacterium]|nr:hypothetical protein [Parachlamydiales bacterium]
MTMTIQGLTNDAQNSVSENTDNFLRKLAVLVAKIYSTFSESSQNDRLELNRQEQIFKRHSFESADLTHSRGNLSCWAAIGSMVIFTGSCFLPKGSEGLAKLMQLGAEKGADFIRPFESHRDGSIKRADTLSQLDQSKIQDTNNHKDSYRDVEGKISRVLDEEMQRRQRAAANGG